MIVPGDPTIPTNEESRLLPAHIHFAKMYEITAYYCRQTPLVEEIPKRFAFWDYQLMDGAASAGVLEITCPDAIAVADYFGTGAPERTTIL